MDPFKKLEPDMLIGPQRSEYNLRRAQQKGIKTVIDFPIPGETP